MDTNNQFKNHLKSDHGILNNPADLRIPKHFIWVVIAICALPFLVNILGLDFGIHEKSLDISALSGMQPHIVTDTLHHILAGSFTHTILEWSAFCAAIFTVILAFVHLSIKHDITIPIIGLALFFAGIMDAFHTLAANRLINAVADNRDLIPFTWAICRLFNALILIVGVGVFLTKRAGKIKAKLSLVILVSLFFGAAAYGIIYVCATSSILPQTMYPDFFITRPYDVLPLILFIVAGVFVFPRFHKKSPSLFSHALIISIIPNVATQLHMSFGSTALFDNHFNIAHFLKIMAYLVPFVGLILDYVQTYRDEKFLVAQREVEINKRIRVEKAQEQLLNDFEAVNLELNNFAYIVSHDLKAPLRAIGSLANWIKTDYADKFDEDGREQISLLTGRVHRMHNLIEGILEYSRVGRIKEKRIKVDLHKVVLEVIDVINPPKNIDTKIEGTLPTIICGKTRIIQVFQNLIGNAVKYIDKPEGKININCFKDQDYWKFSVSDNGQGIDEKYFGKVFQIFQTLKPRDEVEGTGIGLSIVKKIVENYGGNIWIESRVGVGSTFFFTLPRD